MFNKIVSIIVPIYNSEKFLDECLGSIKKQNYENIEVLLIDDGSTDSSIDICKKYSNIDSRFKIIEQNNMGVSAARNNGILHSKGNWIFFLDSDDWLFNYSISDLVLAAMQNNSNIVQGGIINSSILKNETNPNSSTYVFKSYKIAKYLLNPFEYNTKPEYAKSNLLNSTQGCYAKLIKREIIINNKIYFNENLKLGEDLLFYFDILNAVGNICILPNKIYVYRANQFSVTQSFNPKLYEYAIDFSKYFYHYINNNLDYKEMYSNDSSYQIYFHLRLVVDKYFWNPQNNLSFKILCKQLEEYTLIHEIELSLKNIDTNFCQGNSLSYQSLRNRLRAILIKKHKFILLLILGKFDNKVNAFKIMLKRFKRRIHG